MYHSWLQWLSLAVAVAALPTETFDDIGIDFDSGSKPILTLPYARYRAYSYDADNDVYKFQNIRFAAAPVDELRFHKPAPPKIERRLQTGDEGSQCVQLIPQQGLNIFGSLNDRYFTQYFNKIITKIGSKFLKGGDEDCLFLDVYVPGRAIRERNLRLPVVNYLHGGAFLFGEKGQNGMYTPNHLIKMSRGSIIWVTGNYRLGVYGWLAGKTMEGEGQPNAGLHDQRAVLKWIQDYIGLLGGDRNNVIAMGESAGASSIMHHLTAYGGQQDPLFRKAIMQSPAFQIMWDRNGIMEDTFQNFAKEAGCSRGGFSCLQKASKRDLVKANANIQKYIERGSFGVGVATDGSWVRQLGAVELAQGKIWPGIESMIVSHTEDESAIFVDGHIRSDDQFTDFLSELFPDQAQDIGVVRKLTKFYPPVDSGEGPYQNQTQRVRDFIRDSSFTCNVRYLAEAYNPKTWVMQYATYPGFHASDGLATFISPENNDDGESYAKYFKQEYLDTFNLYQRYLVSYILSGDPNELLPQLSQTEAAEARLPVFWPKPSQPANSEKIHNVLEISEKGTKIIQDPNLAKTNCRYLQLLEEHFTYQLGYAPAGSRYPILQNVFGNEIPQIAARG